MRKWMIVLMALACSPSGSRPAATTTMRAAASADTAASTAGAADLGLLDAGKLSVAIRHPVRAVRVHRARLDRGDRLRRRPREGDRRDPGHRDHGRHVRQAAVRHDHPQRRSGAVRHGGVVLLDHAGAGEADRLRRPILHGHTSRSWSDRLRHHGPRRPRGQEDRRPARHDRRRPRGDRRREPRSAATRSSTTPSTRSRPTGWTRSSTTTRSRRTRPPGATTSKIVSKNPTVEDYGLVFAKDNTALRDAFNAGLAEIQAERDLRRDLQQVVRRHAARGRGPAR